MADLGGSGVPATSNGNGAAARTRPTGATSSPSGIRGPRMIMQERMAREEARRRAEQEARQLEETQRRNAERRAAAAAAGVAAGPQTTEPELAAESRVQADPSQTRPLAGGSRQPAEAAQTQQRRERTTNPQRVPEPFTGTTGTQRQPSGAQAGETSAAGGSRTRHSFPHAFERWETLSAHWEGLTSFWIRRLEQSAEQLQDPVSQQLTRQVTDLSAAGANLFHAVVELQRLRASSERKFQRWFVETRSELERAQEVNGLLEEALDQERRGRADAIRDAVGQERANSKTLSQLNEMRKELQISKEEARRAWEELGRREQYERDRTISLQSGNPTIVGGVQVVPMTQGVPSRHASTREREYQAGDYGAESTEQQGDYQRTLAAQQGGYQSATSSPAVGSSTGAPFYQQPQSALHQGGYAGGDPGSEGGYSEEEYETPTTHEGGGYGQMPPVATTQSQWEQQQASPTHEYSSGTSQYQAPGWESMPRHHHPTRLSDVIEEDDERSRTSASVSQVSRG